jgi:polyhydroxybutyrate depolymerase
MKRTLIGLSLALLACAACSSGEGATGTSTNSTASGTGGGTTTMGTGGAGGSALPPIGGDRPVDVTVPDGLPAGEKVPLVMLLHGYGVGGLVEELYMALRPLALKHGFVYAVPTGTVDSMGKYFWNATDACCNFDGSSVDDSAYLAGVIDEIVARYPVDPKRVFLVGHSNGGFMSYRMACDHADKIAAIASLAGAMWLDTAKCAPSQPVHVLQIHGTADADVAYDGSPGIPSAQTTVQDWATLDGCASAPDTSAPPLDLDTQLPGAETTVQRWAQGC